MEYISVVQAAKQLEVSRQRVLILIKEGRIAVKRVGNAYIIPFNFKVRAK